jgi:hypothetical protein
MGDPERRKREPAIRLLPAKPAIGRESRGEDRGAGVGHVCHDRDADQRPPTAPRGNLDPVA